MRNWCVYLGVGLAVSLILVAKYVTESEMRKIFVSLIAKELSLRNGTAGMKMWQVTPVPIFFKVYMWNVTNPKEVSAGGKPKLNEVGPYVYEQWLEKENVREDANDTLSYNQNSRMYFHEKLSGNLSESDVVTIVHLPLVGMVLRVNEIMPDYLGYLEGVWTVLFPGTEDIFMTGTVRDLLFDGVPIDCTSKDFMVTTICNNLEGDLPKTIRKVGNKDFRFSFFNYKNQTSTDLVRVYRGVENPMKSGQIFSFNNEMSANKWHNKYCDMLNGSDGSLFPMNLKENDSVYLYQPDFCRSLYATYEKELSIRKIKLFRFVNTPDLFASVEENANNECFCAPKPKLSDLIEGFGEEGNETISADITPLKTCLKSGAMLLTPCIGAPVVITFPHFYMGDQSFFNYVDLKPSKELHQTFVDIEPISGVPFAARKRIQFNVQVKSIAEMVFMTNLTPGLFPILWVEESFDVGNHAAKLESLLAFNPKAIKSLCIAFSVIILIICYFYYVKKNSAHAREANANGGDVEAEEYTTNGYEANGRVLHRSKLPFNVTGNANLPPNTVRTNGLVPEGSIFLKHNGGRVFPDPKDGISRMYSENYM